MHDESHVAGSFTLTTGSGPRQGTGDVRQVCCNGSRIARSTWPLEGKIGNGTVIKKRSEGNPTVSGEVFRKTSTFAFVTWKVECKMTRECNSACRNIVHERLHTQTDLLTTEEPQQRVPQVMLVTITIVQGDRCGRTCGRRGSAEHPSHTGPKSMDEPRR